MLTYYDLEEAIKHVPLERLPEIYDFILERAEWPFDASPQALETDDQTWDSDFASERSQEFLAQMASKVRAEIRDGQTEPLDHLLVEKSGE
jgi:hypothetical protein